AVGLHRAETRRAAGRHCHARHGRTGTGAPAAILAAAAATGVLHRLRRARVERLRIARSGLPAETGAHRAPARSAGARAGLARTDARGVTRNLDRARAWHGAAHPAGRSVLS